MRDAATNEPYELLTSAGCIVSGSTVDQSILFNNVRVNSYSQVTECVVLPSCEIGRHCKLTRVVIDTHCKIPEGTVIGEDAELDAKRAIDQGARLAASL